MNTKLVSLRGLIFKIQPAFCRYLIQLVKIQNFPFHMRDFQCASLKLPEFGYLIQEIELNTSLCLKVRSCVMNISF